MRFLTPDGGCRSPGVPAIDHCSSRVRGRRVLRVSSFRSRRIKFIAPFAMLAALAITIAAMMVPGDPVGAEFLVNTTTVDNQWTPCVAMDADGDFIVVWSSYNSTWNAYSVVAQLFDSSGAKVGEEFLVDDNSSDQQMSPAVAMQANGNFTVVWQTDKDEQTASGTYNNGIRQAFFDSDGTRVDLIADKAGDDPDEWDPAVAISPSSFQYITVWTTYDEYNASEEISGWRGPTPLTNSTINNYTSDNQETPAVAMGTNGDSVVVWASYFQDGDFWGIFGQKFSSDGNKSGPEFQVNTWTTSSQTEPSVAVDSWGNFVVVWSSWAQDTDGNGVYGQRFSDTGMKVGTEFQVNTWILGNQFHPSVAMSPTGEFIVVWASYALDGSDLTVAGQRYNSDGSTQGNEFQINTCVDMAQTMPSVSVNGNGNSVVVWQSNGQDGDRWGVYGQLYYDAPIPEFTTLVLPIAGVAALVFLVRKIRPARPSIRTSTDDKRFQD